MMAALTVTAITLGELLGASVSAGTLASAQVRDLVIDSRDAHSGAAFVALRGARDHGVRHAQDALARGAEAVLFDPAELGGETLASDVAARAVPVPALAARSGELARKLFGPAMAHVALAGVTGTNGKTTVAYLIAQAMARTGRPCGYIGTLGHGLPPALTAHALTTPDCFTLHREIAALAAGGATHVALEVSSHALAQDRVAGLAIATAAFTNLTRDHLDAHGDLRAYGEAKARLFERDELARAVLNISGAFALRLVRRLAPAVRPIRVAVTGSDGASQAAPTARRIVAPLGGAYPVSRDESAALGGGAIEIRARVRSLGLAGLELDVHGRFGSARLRSPLIGAFNAENLLVALGVLTAWDVPLAAACDALAGCTAPPGRLEAVGSPAAEAVPGAAPAAPSTAGAGAGAPEVLRDRPFVIVDYAHTPDALARTLATVRALGGGELWCVFGCGGERDPGKRAPMGEIAARQADHVVVTDDNPRGEDPDAIVKAILQGVGTHPSVIVEHDRARAIRRAVHGAGSGDVVLIAGKGHETTQRIGTKERPFSDRAAALDALEALT